MTEKGQNSKCALPVAIQNENKKATAKKKNNNN